MELESATTTATYEEFDYEIEEGDTDEAGLENERCGICMDGVIDRGVLDCCEHWFCFACIDNWATITNLCPLCQSEFQLITCVPVYDTIGSGKVEDDSVSRDDDWSIQGTNNTLSFPSYYIDENAVICLDGNGCKVRNGMATSGDDSVLDTSIACDSCDIWYHAFCVDFDPEGTSENSWLCPRCVDDVPQKAGMLSLQMPEESGPERGSREPLTEASHSGMVSVSVADAGETAVVVSMIEGKHWIQEPSEDCLSAQDTDNSKQTLDESNTQPDTSAEGKSLALSLSQNCNSIAPCDSLHVVEDGKNPVDEAVSEPKGSDGCELFSGLLSDRLDNRKEPSVTESNVDLHLGLSVRSSLPADKLSHVATENHKSEVPQLHNFSKEFSLSVGNLTLDANEDVVGSSCLRRNSMNSSDTGATEALDMCTGDEMMVDSPTNKPIGDGESLQTSQKDQSENSTSGTSQEFHLPASSKYKGGDIYAKDATETTVPEHTEAHNAHIMDEMLSDPPGKKAKRDGNFLPTSLKNGGRKSVTTGSQKYSHLPADSKNEAENAKDETGTTVSEHTQVHSIDTRVKMVSEIPAKKAKVDRKIQQPSLKDVARKSISGNGRECPQLTASSNFEIDKINTKEKMKAKVLQKEGKACEKSQPSHLKPEVKKVISDGVQECSRPSSGSKDDISADVPEQKTNIRATTSIVRGANQRHARIPGLNTADKSSVERENGTGLRVKKIMRRGAENESSKLVEDLRKEIREVVRSKAANDLSKSNVFDPKLLLAFRNAIARPKPEHEPVKKVNPAFVRAKKSLLQKGKIRENLTKKIYGNSNGRRKRAWDRDWEVEFWKHRCKRVTRTEKVETLMSVLDLLKDNAKSSETGNDPGDKAANPILSRVYLADASVFPRTDDIKPFSALRDTGPDEINKENSMKKNVRFPMEIGKSSSQYTKKEASCKKLPSNGPVNKQNSACTTSASKANDQSLKEAPGISDVKIDKRKWALEVLARKTNPVQNKTTDGNEEENATLKGNFPLLAQLPQDMKPELAPSRHNKIPISVRKAQLYRLTEHFLRKAELPVIRRTADTELAVADAVNIEKEVVNRSNSKLVYINLCSQALSQHMNINRPDTNITKPETAVEAESSQSVVQTENIDSELSDPTELSAEAALRMAGLTDTPPSSPCQAAADNNDTPIDMDKEPDNVFDIDTQADLDIYGDFEYDLENDDYIGGIVPLSSKQVEDGDSKMKVVFSTLSIPRTDDAVRPKEDESLEIISGPKDPTCQEVPKDAGDLPLEIRAESSCPATEPLHEEMDGELSLAECEELYGPDKEPLVSKFPDIASTTLDNSTVDQGHVETAVCNSSGGENSQNPSLVDKNLRGKEKKTNKPDKDVLRSVSRKVEAYIKEHIRPLCKSGVITVEQYRWAVEKTTTKIMKYHSKETNANFLIKEGEKVKKLAEQYVEAAQKKDSE